MISHGPQTPPAFLGSLTRLTLPVKKPHTEKIVQTEYSTNGTQQLGLTSVICFAFKKRSRQ